MIEPTEADIGRTVIYTGNRYPGGKAELGVITSFNERTVFVRYGADRASKGTDPADLEWASGERPSFTCPRCGAKSFNPNDIRERYCGRCHVSRELAAAFPRRWRSWPS